GSYEESEKYYTLAWDQFQDKYGYIGLIRLEIQRGKHKEAFEMIKDLLSKFGADTRVVILSVEMLLSLGKNEEVVPMVSQYHTISENQELSNYLGTVGVTF
ncbi:MAG: hypothetical protein ACRCTJ_03195, partial [Brevinema sp.]